MADRFDLLAQALFQKPLSDCTVQELDDLATRYPYFAPAQLLRLKRSAPDSEAYRTQYNKAALFYSDPAGFAAFVADQSYEWEEIAAPDIQPVVQEKAVAESLVIDEPVTPTHEITAVQQLVEETPPAVVPVPNPAPPIGDIAFEPFHTVDYFASQGIRLSTEEIPKDKLGRQLKSFTEWLKTMKRLPAAELGVPPGGVEERQVEHLAAYSVKAEEVLTEAMAEVWVRQGNKAKAAEVYRKLSLLNPAKSAYFAAKIDLLKETN